MWHCVSWISTTVSSIAFERNMTYSRSDESSYISFFPLTQIVVLLLFWPHSWGQFSTKCTCATLVLPTSFFNLTESFDSGPFLMMLSYDSVRMNPFFRTHTLFSSSYIKCLTVKNCVSLLPQQSQENPRWLLGPMTPFCYPRHWKLCSWPSKKSYEL